MPALTLTEIQKGMIFKRLASESVMTVGREFGLDKHYSTPNSIKAIIGRIKREVLEDPAKYGIEPQTVEVVNKAMSVRKQGPKAPVITLSDKEHELDGMEIKDLAKRGARVAMVLMNKKLDAAMKSKKMFGELSLGTLATTTGILFDKARLVMGEATEHIALKAKISSDLTPAQRLSMILAMREANTNSNGQQTTTGES